MKGNVEMNDIEKKLEALKAEFLGKLEALQREAEMQKKQEEPKPWKPERGEKYFTIENSFYAFQYTYCEDIIDEPKILSGNCFRTEERAEQVAKKMRLLLRLEQLHDMLCPDYVPDWSNEDEHIPLEKLADAVRQLEDLRNDREDCRKGFEGEESSFSKDIAAIDTAIAAMQQLAALDIAKNR